MPQFISLKGALLDITFLKLKGYKGKNQSCGKNIFFSFILCANQERHQAMYHDSPSATRSKWFDHNSLISIYHEINSFHLFSHQYILNINFVLYLIK